MKMVLAVLFAAILLLPGVPAAGSVGFTTLQVSDGAEPALEVGVWYPTDTPSRATPMGLLMQDVALDAPMRGHGLALVVISHGSGGNLASHAGTALALARAGFVVAAPTHTGDNQRDRSRVTDLAGRSRGLTAVIDQLALRWSPGAIDPARIGAFGFSAGGFTVLAAAGGQPNLSRIGPHCMAHPGFYDCRMMAAVGGAGPVTSPVFIRDERLRALVVAAPALGFTFGPAGLAAVTMPVQLWWAADDAILPPDVYAEPVRLALPRPPEVHVVERAGHFDFMTPCSEALARAAPAICVSAPGFDRVAFGKHFDIEVVAFLTRTLVH